MMPSYELLTVEMNELALRQFRDNALQQGFSFSSLAEVAPDEVEAVYWLHQECRKRQPPVETRQTPQEYDVWLRTFVEETTANPELYFILRKGNERVAVSCLVKTEEPNVFLCGFTGVLPHYAGKGLAIALKSHVLLKAKERGIDKLITQVRDDNLSMLKLNGQLGFHRQL